MFNLVKRFLQQESSGGILLLLSAITAIIFANSVFVSLYHDFLNLPVAIRIGDFSIDKTLIHWINDGFMAVFFVLVGMEVKRELLEGSLASYQQAVFPAIAALGGMIVPAAVYWVLIGGHSEFANGSSSHSNEEVPARNNKVFSK